MSAVSTIQQRLINCCCDSRDENNDKLLLLKNILIEINQQDKHYLIDVEDATSRAPLFHAIESGQSLDFIKQLLDFQARITNRILLCVIRYGNLDILKLLNQYGADFKQTYYGISLLHECILLHKNNLISFLIEEGGINPNTVDYDNQSPLLYAIFRTNVEAIRILLNYSSIDPCLISTRKRQLTCFHVACELGIDEVLPSMIKCISISNINKLSKSNQTPFDLFLSCYLFSKNNLYMKEISLQKFSLLFDLFISNGAKLHHLTKAYRRTRAPYVTKILTILFKKQILFSDIILKTDHATIFVDLESLVCQSLGDWPYIVESNDAITIKQRQLILRQLYELFITVYYKSINIQTINKKLLIRYCSANDKDSKIKQILWLFIKNFIEPTKEIGSLKSICRTKMLLNIDSIDKHCTVSNLGVSKDLESYLLFFTMN
ncbi:unnamed protein product [Rotaria sordida]|uniref:Ankyrin repeat protein n=1 Tax=Rotaria sordida TaxID=392033 RepID=A0A814EU88_9BILA|nr:unnamed protein product [Rotaria sordida]CAF3586586.1 unnamed protein product [Rotaria sordida]